MARVAQRLKNFLNRAIWPYFLFAFIFSFYLYRKVLLSESYSPLYRDLGRYVLYSKSVWADSIRNSWQLPLWDHFSASGTAFFAKMATATMHPFNFIFLLFERDNYPQALDIFLWLHHPFIFMSVFWLFRVFRVRRCNAALGAFFFGLSGLAYGSISLHHELASLMLLPAFFASYITCLRRPGGSLIHLFLASAFLGANVYMGNPQQALIAVIIAAGITLYRNGFTGIIRSSVHLFFLGALSVMFSAFQLLPAIDHTFESARGFAQFDISQRQQLSLHPIRLFEMIFPLFFGYYGRGMDFWAADYINSPMKTPFLLSLHIGTVLVGLAVLFTAMQVIRRNGFFGLPRRQKFRKGLLFAMVTVPLLACMGSFSVVPMFSLLGRLLPLWSSFRYPERISFWPVLLISFFLVLNFDRFCRLLHLRPAGKGKKPEVMVAVALALLSAAAFLSGLLPGLPPIAQQSLWFGSVTIFLMAALFFYASRMQIRGMTFSLIVLITASLETAIWQPVLLEGQPGQIARAETYSHITALKKDIGNRRHDILAGASRRMARVALHDLTHPGIVGLGYDVGWSASTYQIWEAIYPNVASFWQLDVATGYFTLNPYRYFSFWRLLAAKNPDLLMSLLAVRYLPVRTGDNQVQVIVNKAALPYIFLSNGAETLPLPEALQKLTDKSFDPWGQLLVSTDETSRKNKAGVRSNGSDALSLSGNGKLRVLRRDTHSLQLEVTPTGRARYLVWNGNYERHWRAYWNGRRLQPMIANAWALAVKIPEDAALDTQNILEFRYENNLVLWGGYISLIWLFGFAAALIGFTCHLPFYRRIVL